MIHLCLQHQYFCTELAVEEGSGGLLTGIVVVVILAVLVVAVMAIIILVLLLKLKRLL